MTTRAINNLNKNGAPQKSVIEQIRGEKLTFGRMIKSLRMCEELSQVSDDGSQCTNHPT